ncbi:MAG TPA: hypothetical protein EYP35_00870 [Desulfobacterales bacterium]|nr:hypothetical protein [Desulfobacterales bacterium]HIP39059.1 hypothetical protein [Desulfocapsa sulfexigens]
MTIELEEFTLEDILPHRGDMVLITNVLEADETHALTESVMSASFPLADESGVQPLIMVELAAQTAGVCNGLDRIRTQGVDSNKMGWLVGVKRAKFYIDYLPLGSTVVTRSENSHNYENLREVSCVLHMGDTLVGEMTLQLFQL